MTDIILEIARMPLFRGGSLDLYQEPTIRPYLFNPEIPDYRWKVPEGFLGLRPLDFRAGRIEAYFPDPVNLLLTSSPVVVFNSGHIAIVEDPVPAVGALSGFAVWPAAAPDPTVLLVETATNNTSGGVQQAFTRHSATFAVSEEAGYLGIGGKFYGLPGSGPYRLNYLKKVQLEKAPVGQTGPSSFGKAREVQVEIHPDRLNFSTNPCFYVDTSNWTLLTRVANAGSPSGFVGQISIPASGQGLPVHTVDKLTPGESYTVSALVSSTTPMSLTLYEVTETISSAPKRVYASFVAGTQPEAITFALTGAVDASTVTISEVLVEHGVGVGGDYFDGSGGPDYLWETGGVAGSTRSYYYKNRAERYAAVVRILQENTPMGIGIGVPKFGVLPT